jgi:glycosyltransferase involved in cell wall biosynthesis
MHSSAVRPPRLPRVVIDLEKLRHINCGLGRFSFHLGRELVAQAPGQFEPVLLVRGSAAKALLPPKGERMHVGPLHKESIRRLLRPAVTPFLPPPRIDLWHVTNQQSKYLPLDPRVPTLLTIHDLNFLHDEQESDAARRAAKLADVQRRVDRAVAVTTVSEASARDVRDHVKLRGKPVHVVHNGLPPPPPAASRPPAFLAEFPAAGPFLFTLGNALPHKNFHVLLDLLAHLPARRLVIAGKKDTPYGRFLEQEVARRGLVGRVVMPGEVTDGDRQWLYERCEAFLFPSLAEGFGFPVLEALQCGRPAFMPRRTSLPEVAGDLGFYFDSFAPDHMAAVLTAGLAAVAADPDFAGRARRQAARFSWAAAARRYAAIYADLLCRSGHTLPRAAAA